MKRTFGLILLTAFAGEETRAADPSVRALKALSVDPLLDQEITSVSKRLEPLADAVASLYPITREALRRSGATTLPEAPRDDALFYRPSADIAELSRIGGNLLHDRHAEYGAAVSRARVERTIVGQVRWQF